ncbi:hypothetical protein IT413_03810 [Candidatus Peregrinibacteria bacterium]|nr:hypothetical protein [Candidatus Peregrinibacteria bacterium]
MSDQKKTLYFNPTEFGDRVIQDMQLGEVRPETLEALHDQIETMLTERILDTVIGAFTKRDLELFEKMLEDHPELDEVDALMVLASSIDGLKEQLERAINSLYSELVGEASMVERAMKQPLAV